MPRRWMAIVGPVGRWMWGVWMRRKGILLRRWGSEWACVRWEGGLVHRTRIRAVVGW